MTEPAEDETSGPDPCVDIPPATVGRLILYARELSRLRREGESHVSSKTLGQLLSVTDAVVRRDVGYLGQMGRRGIGYEIAPLISQIRETMGTNSTWRVALVGAGSLGNALLRYRGFNELGFELVAAFDNDPVRQEQSVGGIPVLPLDSLETVIVQREVSLAILAIPDEAAGPMAQRLAAAGVVGILNFAPVTLQNFTDICVVNVDLASELQQLSFSVVHRQQDSPLVENDGGNANPEVSDSNSFDARSDPTADEPL